MWTDHVRRDSGIKDLGTRQVRGVAFLHVSSYAERGFFAEALVMTSGYE
jgi:hypothetical protein